MQVTMTYILVNRNSPLQTLCVTRDAAGVVCVVPMSLRDAVRLAGAEGEGVDIVPYEGRPERLELLTDDLGNVDLRGEEEILDASKPPHGDGFDVFALEDDGPPTRAALNSAVIDAILDRFFEEAAASEPDFDVDVEGDDIDIEDI
jgi:hypothetical protein